MSIISEALKKAKEIRSGDARDAQRPLQREIPEHHASKGLNPWLFTLVLLVFLGPVVWPIAKNNKPVSQETPQTIVTGRSQFSVEERPAFFASAEKPTFSLSGIAQFQNSYMAVINGHILKQGDEIEGAKVVAITGDKVELEFRGERLVLENTF